MIVAPGGGLRLVDMESARPSPDSDRYVVVGTPGYLSPQRAAGNDPAVTDDVHSLGAVVWFMATAEPSHAPDRRRLLDRPVEQFGPAVPPAWPTSSAAASTPTRAPGPRRCRR